MTKHTKDSARLTIKLMYPDVQCSYRSPIRRCSDFGFVRCGDGEYCLCCSRHQCKTANMAPRQLGPEELLRYLRYKESCGNQYPIFYIPDDFEND